MSSSIPHCLAVPSFVPSWNSIEPNLTSIISNPYFHTAPFGVGSLLVSGVWGQGLAQKLGIGGLLAIFLPLSYYTSQLVVGKQADFDPFFSCFITSTSTALGLILLPLLKPAPLPARLVVGSLATLTLSLNLNNFPFLFFSPEPEKIKSNPKYELIKPEVKPMRA